MCEENEATAVVQASIKRIGNSHRNKATCQSRIEAEAVRLVDAALYFPNESAGNLKVSHVSSTGFYDAVGEMVRDRQVPVAQLELPVPMPVVPPEASCFAYYVAAWPGVCTGEQ